MASFFLRWVSGWRTAVQISAVACLMQAIALAALLTPISTTQDDHTDAAITGTASTGSAGTDKDVAAKSNIDSPGTGVNNKPNKTDLKPRLTEVLSVAFSSSRFILFLIFAVLSYSAVFAMQDLFPSYFVARGMPAADAARVSSGYPAGMAVSLPLAGVIAGRYPKLFAILVSIGAGISGPLVLVLSQLEPGSSDPTEAARVQRMAQAVLFAAGFCFAPALYLPPVKFGSEYGGKSNKAFIISMGDCAGFLAITLFNYVLPRLLSTVGWGGVMAINAAMLVLSSAVMAYLQWRQMVDPVRELVVPRLAERGSEFNKKNR